MDNVTRALNLAVDVLLTASILSLLVMLAMMGVRSMNDTNDSLMYYYNGSTWKDYDGTVIKGSEIRGLSENNDDLLVKVLTKTSKKYFSDLSSMDNIRSAYYVDPSASFSCTLLKNNGSIVGMMLTEVGAIYTRSTVEVLSNTADTKKGIEVADSVIAALKAMPSMDMPTTYDANTYSAYENYFVENQLLDFYTKWEIRKNE